MFKDAEARDQFRIEIPGMRAANGSGTGIFNPSGDLASFTGGRGTRFVRRRVEDDDSLTVQGAAASASATARRSRPRAPTRFGAEGRFVRGEDDARVSIGLSVGL